MAAQVDLTTIPISPEGGNVPGVDTADSKIDDITVFHDKENFTVKHPLMHRWTLWFTKPASGKVGPPWRCGRFALPRTEMLDRDTNRSDRATTGTTY